jgi:fumarate reductase subunit C
MRCPATEARMVLEGKSRHQYWASIRTFREHFMIRNIAFALALTFAASILVQVIAVSHADAGGACTYTSSDKKKGYKC